MSSLVLSTGAQHIWREQLPQCTNKSALQNYVLRPLGTSKKDTGIELAQHLEICGLINIGSGGREVI